LDFFFFFQAEDGIRDWSVTGVQTCALPILPTRSLAPGPPTTRAALPRYTRISRRPIAPFFTVRSRPSAASRVSVLRSTRHAGRRSEERRVGKEGRCGWASSREKRDDERSSV